MNLQSILKQSSGLKGQIGNGENLQSPELLGENGSQFAELLGEVSEGSVAGETQAQAVQSQLVPMQVNGQQVIAISPKENTSSQVKQIIDENVLAQTNDLKKVIGLQKSDVPVVESQLIDQQNPISLDGAEIKEEVVDLNSILQFKKSPENKSAEVAKSTLENQSETAAAPTQETNKIWGKVNRDEALAVIAAPKLTEGAVVQKSEMKTAPMVMDGLSEKGLFLQKGPQVSAMMPRAKSIQGFEQFSSEETPFVKGKSLQNRNQANAEQTNKNQSMGPDLAQAATLAPMAVAGLDNNMSSSLGLSQPSAPVLDLSQVKLDQTQSAEKIMGQISDYISVHRLQMTPKLEIQFTHGDLGNIQLQVEKAGGKSDEMINIMLTTQSPEAREFFTQHQDKLVQHLNSAGIEVKDFSMDAMPVSSFAAKSDLSGENSSESSSQPQGQFSRSSGNEAQQKRDDSERRKNIWNAYKDQKELA